MRSPVAYPFATSSPTHSTCISRTWSTTVATTDSLSWRAP